MLDMPFAVYIVFLVALHLNEVHAGENEFHRKGSIILPPRPIPFVILVEMDNQTLCDHGLITLAGVHTGQIFSHLHYHVSRSD